MPVVITRLSKARKTLGTKPSRMQRGSLGKEGGKVVGMKFTQDFHLAMNFANDASILEFNVRMKFLAVLLNAFSNRKRQVASVTVGTKGGDTKEGRELVRHDQ